MTRSHCLSELSVIGKKVIFISIANEYLFFKNLLFFGFLEFITPLFTKINQWRLGTHRLCFLDTERNAGNVSISLLTNEAALATSAGVDSGKNSCFVHNQEFNLKIITICCKVKNILTCTNPEWKGSTF